MSNFWHRLPLHQQLVLASTLLLLLTLLVTTARNLQLQRQLLIGETVAEGTGLARSAALVTRNLLINNQYDDLEPLLKKLALYPDLEELTVFDAQGRVLSDVRRNEDNLQPDFPPLRRRLPPDLDPEGAKVEQQQNHLTIWQPIRAPDPLGWVRLVIDLRDLNRQMATVLNDSLLVAFLATLVDLAVLLLLLQRPRRSFRRAVEFAKQMTLRPGQKLDIKPGSREVGELIDALNCSSERLLQKKFSLEQLNHELEQRVLQRTRDLQQSQQRLKRLHYAVTQSRMALVMLDAELLIEEVNHAFEIMFGCDSEAVLGQDLFQLIWSSSNPAPLLDEVIQRLNQGQVWQGEIRARRASGQRFWMMLAITPILDEGCEEERPDGFLVSMEDISERKEYEKQLIQQANFDSLTGLPNRILGFDRLQQAIRMGKREGKKTVVMYLDLDRFKQVNDTLGHRTGDLLLVEVARRLTGCLRPYDVVARLSGDEFLIVLSGVEDPTTVESVAEKILQVLGQAFSLEGRELHIGASIGISVIPDDGEDPEEILRYADTAMYQAKQAGRNCFKYYTQSMNEEAQRRLKLDSALHNALQRDEIELYLQPIVECGSGRTLGAEALMRWESEPLGHISPEQFIPIAEENGLIDQLGEWILDRSLIQLSRLPQLEFVTVNVSTSQFRDAAFVERVRDLLERHGQSAERLHLEITERVLMADQQVILDNIEGLHRLGVALIIDDFGTGYSSLSYLSRFPCHALKIDRSFITAMIEDASSSALVDAIIHMSHALGLQIIAEGVETEQQWRMICDKQTDLVQGYLFSQPLSVEDFRAFLEQGPDILLE